MFLWIVQPTADQAVIGGHGAQITVHTMKNPRIFYYLCLVTNIPVLMKRKNLEI